MKATANFNLLCSLACTSILLSGCNGKHVVASVNGKEITQEDYVKQMEFYKVLIGQQGGQPVYNLAGNQALSDLIRNQLILQFAQKQNMLPTDQQVDAEITRQKKLNQNIDAQLERNGRTTIDFAQDQKVRLAMLNVLAKSVPIQPSEIDKFYANAKKSPLPNFIHSPATVELSIIIVNSEAKMLAADAAFKRGAPFNSVSQRFTDVPEIANNPLKPGYFGVHTYSEIASGQGADAVKTLQKIGTGQTTDWLKIKAPTPKGLPLKYVWIMMKVEKKIPEVIRPLDSDMRERIRQELITSKADMAAYFRNLEEFQKQAKVDVLNEPWKNNFKMQNLNQMPPGSTVTPGS